MVIPPKAALHPIWRIVDDPVRNREVLDRMPNFAGTNLIDRLKPAATALGFSERPLPGSAAATIIFSCQSFGRGRTFAMATDTTFAWGTEFERSWGEGDNRYFRKFWRNVVRWLTENTIGANRRLTSRSTRSSTGQARRSTSPPGHSTRSSRRPIATESTRGSMVRANRNRRLPARAGQTWSRSSGSAVYTGKLTSPPVSDVLDNPGSTLHPLVVDVTAHDGDSVVATSSIQLQVIDDPAEFRDPRPNSWQLERLAQAAAGRVIHTPLELARYSRSTRTRPSERSSSLAALGLSATLAALPGIARQRMDSSAG